MGRLCALVNDSFDWANLLPSTSNEGISGLNIAQGTGPESHGYKTKSSMGALQVRLERFQKMYVS